MGGNEREGFDDVGYRGNGRAVSVSGEDDGGVGYAVAEAGGDAPADGLIARYPFSPEAEKTLQALKPGAPLLLLAGVRPPETLLNLYDVRLLLDDPVFVHENAVLTAEGALCAAMRDTPFALVEARVMVVGYGRIGRALANGWWD